MLVIVVGRKQLKSDEQALGVQNYCPKSHRFWSEE